jgi:hypothetical protein
MPLHPRSDAGLVPTTIAVALLSLILGGGAAILAVKTVVNSYGANDQVAVQTGPANVLDPGKIIAYGG